MKTPKTKDLKKLKKTKTASQCCNAPVKVAGGEIVLAGQTYYYVCTKCEKPCNVIIYIKPSNRFGITTK